jgi:hypothetical protein
MSQYNIPDFIKTSTIKDLVLLNNKEKEKEKEKNHPINIITENDILLTKADPFYFKNDETVTILKTTFSYVLDNKSVVDNDDDEEVDPVLMKIYKVISNTLTLIQLSTPMPTEMYDSYVVNRNKFEKYTPPILKKSKDIYESVQISLNTIDTFVDSIKK